MSLALQMRKLRLILYMIQPRYRSKSGQLSGQALPAALGLQRLESLSLPSGDPSHTGEIRCTQAKESW